MLAEALRTQRRIRDQPDRRHSRFDSDAPPGAPAQERRPPATHRTGSIRRPEADTPGDENRGH